MQMLLWNRANEDNGNNGVVIFHQHCVVTEKTCCSIPLGSGETSCDHQADHEIHVV